MENSFLKAGFVYRTELFSSIIFQNDVDLILGEHVITILRNFLTAL